MSFKDYIDIDVVKEQSSIADGLGIPSLNRFVCMIHGVPLASSSKLAFQVLDVNCPGFSLQEGQMIELNGAKRYYFMGRSDSDLEVTFLETANLTIRDVFFKWIQRAANVSEFGVIRDYMENYTAPLAQIFPLDYQAKAYNADSFTHIFPYDVGMINYSYGRHDILKTTVKFKYMYHYLTPVAQ